MTRSRDLANLGDITSTLENQGLTLISTTNWGKKYCFRCLFAK
jgi:hypothetical protein